MSARYVQDVQNVQTLRTGQTLAAQGSGRYVRISAHALRATPHARTAPKQPARRARMLPPVRTVRSVRRQAQQGFDLYVAPYVNRADLYVRARAPFLYPIF